MSNAQKTPFVESLNRFTELKIEQQQILLSRALPASVVSVQGAIVTIKFEIDNSQTGYTFPQIAIPLFGPEYIRYPVQVGDKGFTIPADVSLRAISGLGTGNANLSRMFNLTPLVFLPIGNQNWTLVDPNSVTIYGPNGVVLRDTGSNTILTLTPSGINIQSNFTYMSGNLISGGGASGAFGTSTGQTVTVVGGIITNID